MSRTGGGDDGGYRVWPAVSEDECLAISALLNMEKIDAKFKTQMEFCSQYTFVWGRKKIRSVLAPKSPAAEVKIGGGGEKQPEKVVAIEAAESPATPLAFLPSGSDSDKSKPESPEQLKKNSKKRSREEWMMEWDRMTQENKLFREKIETVGNLHQGLKTENLKLKAIQQQVSYSWGNPLQMNQIAMYFPHPQLQLNLAPLGFGSGKVNSGGGFVIANEKDPRGNIPDLNVCVEEGLTCEPFDIQRAVQVDNDLRARELAAAAARRKRMMKIKESRRASRG